MIIGLIGKKGSGKSTAARIAKEEYGYKILSFAKPLKEMLCDCFGFPMHYFTDPVLKEAIDLPVEPSIDFIKKLTDYAYHNLIPVSSQLEVNMILALESFPKRVTPRTLMQFVGTDLFRNCVSENYWIHVMEMQMDVERHFGNRFIFDDTRFPQEIEFIRNKGGLLMKLVRPMPAYLPVDNHSSETFIDEIETDFMIRNDDLTFFKEAVRYSITEAYQEFRER
jgi:hypothetical protein